MKIFKKIGIGLALLVLLNLALSLFLSPKALADTANPSNKDTYWRGCVLQVLYKYGDTCYLSQDGDSGSKFFEYRGAQQSNLANDVTYGVPPPPYTSPKVPNQVKLFDSSSNIYQFIGGSQYAVFSYGGTGTYPDSASGSSTPYYYYSLASDANYTLLATADSSGNLTILSITNNAVYGKSGGTFGSAGGINALFVNKGAVLLDASGKPVGGGGVVAGGLCSGGAGCGPDGKCFDPSKGCTPAATTGPPSCESNFDSPFAFVICPVLRLIDSAAGSFNSFIDQQLFFCTGQSSTSGASCPKGTTNNLTDPVKNGWSIFRIIATALLIIIMLVAVISQALGGQIFDAYAIRKILPKLVIAVIAIQLSWYIFKFFIDLTNDVGQGIQSLMFAPFGGQTNMALDKLVGHGVNLAGGGAAGASTIGFFAILAALGGAFIASIPGLLLLGLYVLLALFVAFVTLILRKILIILLVILSPLALIAWILPGTNSYWKLWSDNFRRVLLMFPLIMALIAAGRIFAYIAAGTPTASMFAVIHLGSLPIPYPASVQGFADLAIIVVAFFAPYFLLPQTFKWGGKIMGEFAKGARVGVERAAKPATEYLDWRKGLSPWRQARAARKAEVERRAKAGFVRGLAEQGGPGFRGALRGARGRYRRARLGGVGMPEAEATLRGRIVQSAEAEVEKQRKEDEQRAVIQLMQHDLPRFHQDSQNAVREAIATGATKRVQRLDGAWEDFDGAEYARSHEHGQRAALDRALAHGQMGTVDQYYTEAMASGDARRIAEATRFKDDNAPVLGEKLTHVLKGYSVAVRATSGEIAKQSGHEVESILARYSSEVAARTAAGNLAGAAAAQAELDGYMQRHQEARANPTLSGSVDLRGTAAVDAYAEIRTAPPVPPGAPIPPALAHAREVIDEINTGTRARARAAARAAATGTPIDPDADREANRSRYRTPPDPVTGRPRPEDTIPLITT